MEHKKLNRIIAAIVFAIAFVVYTATVAPTTSYWDCGEFITCSYILGVPHPPGAPLYILIGRVFSMIPFVQDIGLRVNMISVLMSALSVLFTYLIIVRLLRAWRGIPERVEERFILYAGGVIGALGFAFTDSFWFNAIEAEVYALSMFFTAIVVWLMLVWVEKADEPAGDKILLFIMYLIGLAIGVHLLNIVAWFSLCLIFYFKRFKVTLASFLWLGVASVSTFFVMYPGIVKGVPWVIERFSFLFLGVMALFPVFLAFYAVKNRKRLLSLLSMGMLLILVGYSSYTALYIRSGLKPAINENHPDNPKKLASYLNREQYGDIPFTTRRAPFWDYQIKKMNIRYFGWQFIGHGNTIGRDGYVVETLSLNGLMGLPFLVGLLGLYYHFKNDWKGASVIAVLFLATGLAITIYLNQEDPQPRERDYTYVGSYLAFSLWIGLGASALVEFVLKIIKHSAVLRKVGVALALVALFLAVPHKLFEHNYESHNRSGNYVAYDYSYNILQSCERNAILFTNGDNDTFPLWFLQYVYGVRPDVRVVNLSLLNTHWYVKQLRDEEPRVPMGRFPDSQVDRLQAQRWKAKKRSIPVSRELIVKELEKAQDNATLKPEEVPEKPVVSYTLSHSKKFSGTPVLLVQDFMIDRILRANRFRRPVYFAVTVAGSNMLGLGGRRGNPNYLRMDGLAFRVMPYSGPPDFISHKKLQTNLFEKFQYRNLNNPDVYYNRNIKGLLQNYRSAFVRLANYYQTVDESEKAIAVLDKMAEVMPEEVIPLRDYRLSLSFGRLYADAGRPEELERRLERIIETYPLSPREKLFIAQTYSFELKDESKAEAMMVKIMQDHPDYQDAYRWLVSHHAKNKEYEKAIAILETWLARKPDDRIAQRQLTNLLKLVEQDSIDLANAADADTDTTRTDGKP
ncbi:MAG: protein O-mannosyl-transferase family [bacterium]